MATEPERQVPPRPARIVHGASKTAPSSRVGMAAGDRLFRRRMFMTVATVFGTALLLAGIWLARTIVLLIYASALVAIGLSPLVKWLERRHWPWGRLSRAKAVALVFLGGALCVALAALLVVPSLVGQANELKQQLPQLFTRAQNALMSYGLISQRMSMADALSRFGSEAQKFANPVAGAVFGVVGGLAGAVTIVILTLYFLIDGPSLGDAVMRWVPASRRETVKETSRTIIERVSACLRANFICAMVMGSAAAIGLGLMRAPFFFVLAGIAAIAEAVPMIGSFVAGLIAVALALTSSAKLALMVAIFFFVMHEFEANVLVPKIMERQTGLSSTIVFIAMLIGGEWLGVGGVVLAIPTAAAISAVLDTLRGEDETASGRDRTREPAESAR